MTEPVCYICGEPDNITYGYGHEGKYVPESNTEYRCSSCIRNNLSNLSDLSKKKKDKKEFAPVKIGTRRKAA